MGYDVHGHPLIITAVEHRDLIEMSAASGMEPGAYLKAYASKPQATPNTLYRKLHVLNSLGGATPLEIEAALSALHYGGAFDSYGNLDGSLAELWRYVLSLPYTSELTVAQRIGQDLLDFVTPNLGKWSQQSFNPQTRPLCPQEDPEFQAVLEIRISGLGNPMWPRHANALLAHGIEQGATRLERCRRALPGWMTWIAQHRLQRATP